MAESDLKYFMVLKQKISLTFRKTYAVNQNIKDWKGQDILNFQEDLSNKTKGRISEKWFYTHLKNNSGKLPRIDMLNLLSIYAGYQNWTDFKNKTNIHNETVKPKTRIDFKSNRKWRVGVLVIILIFLAYSVVSIFNTVQTYQFCFVDADRNQPILYPIEIIELRKNESPLRHQSDSLGCFKVEVQNKELSFIIKSPYYKTDTITRLINHQGTENIKLRTNDYALMIHLFSNSKVDDWKKRRQQLHEMIANHAEIYQIDKNALLNMELYNKKEFINKLTMPVNSLKNIEILETIYEGHQIVKMRFRQATEK